MISSLKSNLFYRRIISSGLETGNAHVGGNLKNRVDEKAIEAQLIKFRNRVYAHMNPRVALVKE